MSPAAGDLSWGEYCIMEGADSFLFKTKYKPWEHIIVCFCIILNGRGVFLLDTFKSKQYQSATAQRNHGMSDCEQTSLGSLMLHLLKPVFLRSSGSLHPVFGTLCHNSKDCPNQHIEIFVIVESFFPDANQLAVSTHQLFLVCEVYNICMKTDNHLLAMVARHGNYSKF